MSTTPQAKQTLDQRRARHAWQAVQAAKKQEGCHEMQDPKKFGGQARKLPIRIMASGLGQALAFLKAKNNAPGLLVEIADWVLDKRANPESKKAKPGDDALLNQIITGTSDFLRRTTDEVLAYLLWLNRFAEAEGLTEGEE
ncbi:MAG: type III-B CRISPR module-associated protein Cmr5 [Nitrospiraceae bacterium]|nr:type III-B CRISPR module-associated protein Cmr5 [Nitrospiraceae bacterium]